MRTFQAEDGTLFHYNADFSGDVIVATGGAEFRVHGDSLLELVARAFVAPARIRLLEDLGADSEAAIAKLRSADVPALLLNTI